MRSPSLCQARTLFFSAVPSAPRTSTIPPAIKIGTGQALPEDLNIQQNYRLKANMPRIKNRLLFLMAEIMISRAQININRFADH